MDSATVIHLFALLSAFAAASLGTLALLRQVIAVGLLPLPRSAERGVVEALAHRLGAIAAERRWFAERRPTIRRDLVRARDIAVDPDDFIGRCLALAAAAAFAGWLVTVGVGGAFWNPIPAAIAAVLAFQAPIWNLRSRALRRIVRLTRRLPYSLEVVVLATEAGAGFDEALAILVREEPDEPLHEEFDQVLRDMHLGVSRRDALNAMAQRTGTDDLAALVLALDVGEDLGTPLAGTLKKQAETIRNNRLHRAEKLAREAGPKMALPNTMIMVANVLLILAPFLPKLTMSGEF